MYKTFLQCPCTCLLVFLYLYLQSLGLLHKEVDLVKSLSATLSNFKGPSASALPYSQEDDKTNVWLPPPPLKALSRLGTCTCSLIPRPFVVGEEKNGLVQSVGACAIKSQ